MSEQTKKIPTQGSFKVTSVATNEVVHEGLSKQIEICYRDYLSWALKGTAPKKIQAVVDASEKTALPITLFKLDITPMDDATFAAATHKATTTAAPKQPKYLTLLDQLQAEIKKDVSILPALRLAVAKLFAPEEVIEPAPTTETDPTIETANEIETDDETDTLTEMALDVGTVTHLTDDDGFTTTIIEYPEPEDAETTTHDLPPMVNDSDPSKLSTITEFGKEITAALENDAKNANNNRKHGKNRK